MFLKKYIKIGVKIQTIRKSEIAILQRIQFSSFRHLLLVICFSIHCSAIDRSDDHFWLNIAWHDVTETLFSQRFQTKFDQILRQGVKLMSDKIRKLWYRYLTSFLSYREYSRGADYAPQQGAGSQGSAELTLLPRYLSLIVQRLSPASSLLKNIAQCTARRMCCTKSGIPQPPACTVFTTESLGWPAALWRHTNGCDVTPNQTAARRPCGRRPSNSRPGRAVQARRGGVASGVTRYLRSTRQPCPTITC